MEKKLYNNVVTEYESHPFHIVDPSPWPLFTSIALYSTALGFIVYFHNFFLGKQQLLFSIFSVIICLTAWFNDIIRESWKLGYHTLKVKQNIFRYDIIYCIWSYVFFSFFWAFFHFSLAPSIWIGAIWPPEGISSIDHKTLPLLNTFILISSSGWITISHDWLKTNGFRKPAPPGTLGCDRFGYPYRYGKKIITYAWKWEYPLFITIALAIFFARIQFKEYDEALYSINDSAYGSIFYMLTGFHGLHVIVGAIFLIVCWIRSFFFNHFATLSKDLVRYNFYKGSFLTKNRYVGFVCAIWYWHFVDVVWVIVYVFVYIWGGHWDITLFYDHLIFTTEITESNIIIDYPSFKKC